MFNTYGENINNLMKSIAEKLDYETVNDSNIIEYRHTHLIKPLREILRRITNHLIELDRIPYAKLNSSKYEYATLLNNTNSSMIWAYSENEYPTFREWCKGELNMSTASVTMYLKTGKDMLMKDKPLNIFGNQDFSISNLYTLSSIPVDQLKTLYFSGAISADMKARELQAFVRNYKYKSLTDRHD